jgi:hypothetical protein
MPEPVWVEVVHSRGTPYGQAMVSNRTCWVRTKLIGRFLVADFTQGSVQTTCRERVNFVTVLVAEGLKFNHFRFCGRFGAFPPLLPRALIVATRAQQIPVRHSHKSRQLKISILKGNAVTALKSFMAAAFVSDDIQSDTFRISH